MSGRLNDVPEFFVDWFEDYEFSNGVLTFRGVRNRSRLMHPTSSDLTSIVNLAMPSVYVGRCIENCMRAADPDVTAWIKTSPLHRMMS
jgi:hypothetical protein